MKPVICWSTHRLTILAGESWVSISFKGGGAIRRRGREELGALARELGAFITESKSAAECSRLIGDCVLHFRRGQFSFNPPGLTWQKAVVGKEIVYDLQAWLARSSGQAACGDPDDLDSFSCVRVGDAVCLSLVVFGRIFPFSFAGHDAPRILALLAGAVQKPKSDTEDVDFGRFKLQPVAKSRFILRSRGVPDNVRLSRTTLQLIAEELERSIDRIAA